MKEYINIGLCGLNFMSGNLGCAALAYSFVEILQQFAIKSDRNINVYNISPINQSVQLLDDKQIKIISVAYKVKSIKSHKQVRKIMNRCDIIFDFTEGDSFTDIYGLKRFIAMAVLKWHAISSQVVFVLGPQTYGPFNKNWTKNVASQILKRSTRVYSRDVQSAQYVKKIANIDAMSVIDVAFALPYIQNESEVEDGLIKVGINISGLLWNGGYTGYNEFGLLVDYKEYNYKIIEKLITSQKYEIYLIPHVISEESVEDDLLACKAILEKFPECNLAPKFSNPMQAKSYISCMDVFLGARMHSTIASYSTGIATIPFSYSRKFEGLYETLGYEYCIHGTQEDTINAIDKTINYIEKYEQLEESVKMGNLLANKLLKEFENQIHDLLMNKRKVYN